MYRKKILFAIAAAGLLAAGGCSATVENASISIQDVAKIEEAYIPYEVSQLDLYSISDIKEQERQSIFLLGFHEGKLLYAVTTRYEAPNSVMALEKTERVNVFDIETKQVAASYPLSDDFYVLYGAIAGNNVFVSGIPLKEEEKTSQILYLSDGQKVLLECDIPDLSSCPKLVPYGEAGAVTLLGLPAQKGYYSVTEQGLSEFLLLGEEDDIADFDFRCNGRSFLAFIKNGGKEIFCYSNPDAAEYLEVPEGLKIVTYALCGENLVLFAREGEKDAPVLYLYSFRDQTGLFRIAEPLYRIPDGVGDIFAGVDGSFAPYLYQIKGDDVVRSPADFTKYMEKSKDTFQTAGSDTGQIAFNAPENETVFIIQTD